MGDSRLGGQFELAALRATLRGDVLTAADAGYDDARRVFNAAIDARPAVIVQPASPADVARALSFGRDRGLSVTVRSGGHGVSGQAVAGELVIDLAALHGVTVSPSARIATVRGGTRWRELDAATLPHGLAVPGSRFGAVGVTGCGLEGGDGWMSAAHGTTRENVVFSNVVRHDGSLTRERPDSFGSDDGVIVSVTLRLHEIATRVLGGMGLYRVRDAAEIAAVVGDLVARGCPEFAPLLAFTSAPAARFVPGDIVGRPVAALIPAWLGDPDTGLRFIAPLRRVPALADSIAAMGYADLQTSLNQYVAPGLRSSWTSSPATLTAELIDEFGDAAMAFPNRRTHLTFAPAAQSTWTVQLAAQWSSAAHDAHHASWASAVLARISGRAAVPSSEGVAR